MDCGRKVLGWDQRGWRGGKLNFFPCDHFLPRHIPPPTSTQPPVGRTNGGLIQAPLHILKPDRVGVGKRKSLPREDQPSPPSRRRERKQTPSDNPHNELVKIVTASLPASRPPLHSPKCPPSTRRVAQNHRLEERRSTPSRPSKCPHPKPLSANATTNSVPKSSGSCNSPRSNTRRAGTNPGGRSCSLLYCSRTRWSSWRIIRIFMSGGGRTMPMVGI